MSPARRIPSGLIAFALAATPACIAAPAAAQGQQTVGLTGAAGRMCSISQPAVGAGALNNFDSPSGSLFSITSLGDAATLSTRAANITLSMDAMCNSVHRVVIASDGNGLWRTQVATGAAGFGSAVPYRANLVWADEQQAFNTLADQRRQVEQELIIGRPNTGQMLLEFQIDAGATNAGAGAPLLAGEYSDVLRVTVEAQ